MRKNKGIIFRLLALLTALFISMAHVAPAQKPDLRSDVSPLSSHSLSCDALSLPRELGSIESCHRSSERAPFIIFIQDAHAILDAQMSIQKIIEQFQSANGIHVIALEGGSGRLDPALLRAFPDGVIRRKVIEDYLRRGDLTGAEAASILNREDAVYAGIEDWRLYEENHRAYLNAVKQKNTAEKNLQIAKSKLNLSRRRIYSPILNEFHEKSEAFYDGQMDLLELAAFLAARIIPEIPESRAQTLWAAYPNIFFLAEWMSKSPALEKPDTEQSNTLSALKGTELFGQVEGFLRDLEDQLMTKPEEKELAAKYRKIRLLKNLISLELSSDGFQQLRRAPEEYYPLIQTEDGKNEAPLLSPALEFYRLAKRRDKAFHRNLTRLLDEENAKAAIVVAGGFHAKEFVRYFKKRKYSYAVITPDVSSLDGLNAYHPIMQGELSYKKYLETTFYDAFMRHALEKMTQGLGESAFPKTVALWRDQILRRLLRENRILEAGKYTRYLDLLYKRYFERFDVQPVVKSRKQALQIIHRELNHFKTDILNRPRQSFAGLSALGKHVLTLAPEASGRGVNRLVDFYAPRSENRLGATSKMPAFELLKALELEKARMIDAAEGPLGSAVRKIEIPRMPLRRKPAEPFKNGLEILYHELETVRQFELLYNAEGFLIAIFPALDEKGGGFQPRPERGRPRYFDLTPYYFEIPAIGDPQAPELWKKLSGEIKRNQRIIEEFKLRRKYSLKSPVGTLDRVVKHPNTGQNPFVYVEVNRGNGALMKIESMDPDFYEAGEFNKIRPDAFQLIFPVFPTVYSPAEIMHIKTDKAYYESIGNQDKLNWEADHKVLVGFAGSGFDAYLAYLALLRRQKGEDERSKPTPHGLKLYAYEINPFAAANIRATAKLADFEVEIKNKISDFNMKFDRIIANMPATSFSAKGLKMQSPRMPLDRIWDGDYVGAILRDFARKLPLILDSKGMALAWNSAIYGWKGTNHVEEIFKSAGIYKITAKNRQTPEKLKVRFELIAYGVPEKKQSPYGLYFITHLPDAAQEGLPRSEARLRALRFAQPENALRHHKRVFIENYFRRLERTLGLMTEEELLNWISDKRREKDIIPPRLRQMFSLDRLDADALVWRMRYALLEGERNSMLPFFYGSGEPWVKMDGDKLAQAQAAIDREIKRMLENYSGPVIRVVINHPGIYTETVLKKWAQFSFGRKIRLILLHDAAQPVKREWQVVFAQLRAEKADFSRPEKLKEIIAKLLRRELEKPFYLWTVNPNLPSGAFHNFSMIAELERFHDHHLQELAYSYAQYALLRLATALSKREQEELLRSPEALRIFLTQDPNLHGHMGIRENGLISIMQDFASSFAAEISA